MDLDRAQKLEGVLQQLKDQFERIYPETKEGAHLNQPTGSKRKAQPQAAPTAKKPRIRSNSLERSTTRTDGEMKRNIKTKSRHKSGKTRLQQG
jgi:hypothetical protein